MADASAETGGIPFDNTFAQRDAYLARQASTNDPHQAVFTWKYDLDGTNHIVLPINGFGRDGSFSDLTRWLEGYQETRELLGAMRGQQMREFPVIDICVVNAALWAIFRRLDSVHELSGITYPLRLQIKLRGMAGRIPFLDVEVYSEFIRTNGLPLVHFNSEALPGSRDFFEIEPDDQGRPLEFMAGLRGAIVMSYICEALGIPQQATAGDQKWYPQLLDALERAKLVQENRRRR